MQASSSLRFGNIGPLNIRLHYTWLLAAVLVLWWLALLWLALLWLPDNYPGWPGAFYWLVSVAVLALFFLSVITHELVHSVTARNGRRTLFLFPFGAAQPFRLQELEPARAVMSSIAGPVFNLVLGGLLLAAGGLINDTVGLLGCAPGGQPCSSAVCPATAHALAIRCIEPSALIGRWPRM